MGGLDVFEDDGEQEATTANQHVEGSVPEETRSTSRVSMEVLRDFVDEEQSFGSTTGQKGSVGHAGECNLHAFAVVVSD